MILHRLTDRLAVSDAPSEEDLRELVARGVRSIVDLRADGEPRPRGVAPWEEARLATGLGLAYRQIPVEPPRLGEYLGDLVRRAVREATPPVLLHCTTGRRAGVFGLIVLACDERLPAEQYLACERNLGLNFEGMPRLSAFLKTYVRCRAEGPVPADARQDFSLL
jgi:uncharacterized protein (TIGR01244 family)